MLTFCNFGVFPFSHVRPSHMEAPYLGERTFQRRPAADHDDGGGVGDLGGGMMRQGGTEQLTRGIYAENVSFPPLQWCHFVRFYPLRPN